VAILGQSSADFALTYNFQGTHIFGASRGHLCDSVIFLYGVPSVTVVTVYNTILKCTPAEMSKNHEADLKCHLRWQLSLAWSQSQSSLQTNTVDSH